MKARALVLAAVVIFVLAFLGSGCSILQKGQEAVSKVEKSPVLKTAVALRNSFADITEEEEYYIGRSVSALILSKYDVYQNEPLTQYVNKIGSAVAAYSDRPETYGGYHFLILNSSEINALAAPGGFVFITKGLVTRCRDEEMLASVLAHEVGHVASKHGLKAIKQSRLVDTFKMLGSDVAAKYTPAQLSQLTELFEGALSDIAGQLIEKGYDRKLEYEADTLSIKFTLATGYNPNGLAQFLETLTGEAKKEGVKGWFQTHPDPQDRLDRVKKQISKLESLPKENQVRNQRFKQAVSGLK